MLVQFPALAGYVSVLQSVQTGCVPTQAPIQCVQVLLYGDKRQVHEADHLVRRLRMNVVMPSLRHISYRPSRVQLKFAFTIYRNHSQRVLTEMLMFSATGIFYVFYSQRGKLA